MKKHPQWIIGIDEVGRGPLAGPVTVCAVLMRYDFYRSQKWDGLTDSKKLSEKKRIFWHREALLLRKKGELGIAVVSRSASAIDKKGISVCIRECIASCLLLLGSNPKDTQVLLDGGLKAPEMFTHQKTVIRGDQKHKIISLASVVAKVTRDAYMKKIHTKHPEYDFINNKGYGTQKHRDALRVYCASKNHRISFLSRIIDNF